MEYLIVGVLDLPNHLTDREIAKVQAKLVEHVDIAIPNVVYMPNDRKPRVYWAFHPLNVPFPKEKNEKSSTP